MQKIYIRDIADVVRLDSDSDSTSHISRHGHKFYLISIKFYGCLSIVTIAWLLSNRYNGHVNLYQKFPQY